MLLWKLYSYGLFLASLDLEAYLASFILKEIRNFLFFWQCVLCTLKLKSAECDTPLQSLSIAQCDVVLIF